MSWIARIVQTLVLGSIGYSFPRFLVAIGIPLDEWANALGRALTASWINWDSVLWGFVVTFTLVMFWVEGRYNFVERMFYAARPVKLNTETVWRYVGTLQTAHTLINEAMLPGFNLATWQPKVIQWNQEVETMLRETLPRKELFGYTTVTFPPIKNQRLEATLASLQVRCGKLRAIANRYLPPRWDDVISNP